MNLSKKEIAAENTFKCNIDEHDHYWCYLCEGCLNYKNATIDHIRPESFYKEGEDTSQNNGLGTYKKDWLEHNFNDNYWPWNNLVLTHKKCNESKGDEDTTSYYGKILKED